MKMYFLFIITICYHYKTILCCSGSPKAGSKGPSGSPGSLDLRDYSVNPEGPKGPPLPPDSLGETKPMWGRNFFLAKHLQQIHRNKDFCRMYGLGVMIHMTTSKVHLSIQIVLQMA